MYNYDKWYDVAFIYVSQNHSFEQSRSVTGNSHLPPIFD